MGASTTERTAHVACDICQKTFGRTEHLKRHVLSHTKDRRFRCEICGKNFLRRDALHRHNLTHQFSEPSLLKRGARACFNCKVAKIRCTGDACCRRCQSRELPCVYPDENNRHNLQQPQPGDAAITTSVVDRSYHYDLTSRFHDHEQPLRISAQTSRASTRLLDSSAYSGPMQMAHPESCATTSPLPSGNRTDSSTPHQHEADDQFPSSPYGAEFPPMQDSFEPDLWNPSILSTVNWLGMDVDPLDVSLHLAPRQSLPYQFSESIGHVQPPQETPIPQIVSRLASVQQDRTHSTTGYDESRSDSHSTGSPVTVESSICSANMNGAQAEAGEFYVDGQPARLPRVKRRKVTSKVSARSPAGMKSQLTLSYPYDSAPAIQYRFDLALQDYENMKQAFHETCAVRTASKFTFHPVEFPPRSFIETLIGLYVDSFHPIFPLLHLPTFGSSGTHWLLELAMAAVGSHYLDFGCSELFAESIHEFLQRVISSGAVQHSIRIPDDETTLTQIRILQLTGVVYGGYDSLLSSVYCFRQGIIDFCENKWHIREQQRSTATVDLGQNSVEAGWSSWRDEQVRCRTGYCFWLLDAMSSFHFQERPSLELEDAQAPLPCHEKLWDAPTAHEWNQLKAYFPPPPNLIRALENIYIDKKLPATLGEYSRILLIHGIFRRTWEVETYIRQPLSQWEPTAQKQSISAVLPRSAIWPPSVPLYTRWRNSACDCLDILHWSANATIGSASGIEYPTVMHLHLARVVLLAPYSSIVVLAKRLGSESHPRDTLTHQNAILKWTTRDQYKARLAMIHAGVLFWHIRRYSANGFYEPSSVALATLALWAFSAFSPIHDQGSESAKLDITPAVNGDVDGEESAKCNIILLDRPTDDELVQDFVRRGHSMHAHITGVGDLYGAGAPVKVLREGRRLLGTLAYWALKEQWMEVLKSLEEVDLGSRDGKSFAEAGSIE